MSVEVETVSMLDERQMLGPKVHICCCQVDRLVTFCGIEATAKDKPRVRRGEPLSCAPCVEKHEKDVCPRFGTCQK
jgi:hypothetical protein